jgi:hypothetical protein
MFCNAYNKSLIDAAAAGGELTPALREHLASCEFCRNAFAQEQSLFAAIDSSLWTAANAEVPATLIPRVHVALNSETISQGRSFNLLWSLAGAAVTAAVVLGLLYFPFRRESTPTAVSGPTSAAKVVQDSPDQLGLNPVRDSGVSSLHHAKAEAPAAISISRGESPEVLVPLEEGAALLRYEEFLRRRQAGGVFMATAKSLDLPQGIEPLQIKAMEMGALNIPALSKWDSEGDTK